LKINKHTSLLIISDQKDGKTNLNKKNNNKQRGITLIELIVVMALFAIVGSLIVTLMRSGGKFNEDVQRNADAQSSARIAMSYITVKIRQNDSLPVQTLIDSGVKNNVWVEADKLSIYQNGKLKWGIYFHPSDRALYENIYDVDGIFKSRNVISTSIASVGSGIEDVNFYYKEADNTIEIVVKYNDNIADRELKQTISLRTD